MPDIRGTSRAQTLFLRAFRKNPSGPPPEEWPSPVVLRRWLKRRGFCGAMNSILRALRYQADFHLTAAAASGAHLLHGAVHGGDVHEVRRNIESLIHLLRMSHIRHRFAEPLPQPEPRMTDWIAQLRMAHPSLTVRDALALFDVLAANHGGNGFPGEGVALWRKTGHPDSPQVEHYQQQRQERQEREQRAAHDQHDGRDADDQEYDEPENDR